MTRFLSQKFRFYSFVCIALLPFVHGYNLSNAYLTPFYISDEPLTFTTFFELLLANGLLRFRIPLLFIISGYIFAMQDNKPYGSMVKKRFTTLIIPYFIWSAVGLLLTWVWQRFPLTAEAVTKADIDQMGDNRPYEQIGWHGMLLRWVLVPISFQLWFVRSLFIYNLIYPFFKWVVIKYPLLWFSVTVFLWSTLFNIFFFEGQGLLFFTFGIWLNKSGYNLEKKPEWFSQYLAWVCFIGIAVIKTFMSFELEGTALSFWVLTILYAATVISGLLAVWYGADEVVKWCMQQKWFVWMAAFSFVIFGLHVPLIQYVIQLLFMFLNTVPHYRLLVYLLAPPLVTGFCILFGAAFRSLLPGFYRVATGGRGF